MSTNEVLQLLDTVGWPVITVFALLKGWIIPKLHYDDLKADSHEWKSLALGLMGTADRATTMAEGASRR